MRHLVIFFHSTLRVDASTSPTLSKKRCSHIKTSTRRRGSSHGSFSVRPSRSRSRTFSVVALQQYLYFFGSTPIAGDDVFMEDDLEDDDEVDNIETGCARAWLDQNVNWFTLFNHKSVNTVKFKVFALFFMLLSIETLCLYKVIHIFYFCNS